MKTSADLHDRFIQLKSMISGRWRLFIFVFIVVALPATIASLSKPLEYRVQSKLMFEQNRRVNIELSSQLSERAARTIIPAERLNTQIEAIRGNYLIRQVVQALHLADGEEAEREAIDRIQKKLETRVIPASTIIEISYTDTDPDRAQNIVNTLTECFQDFYMKTVEGDDAPEFYMDRFRQADYRLNENYRRLNELRMREGIFTTFSDAKRNLRDHIFELRKQISDSEISIRDQEARYRSLQVEMVRHPKNIKGSVEHVLNPTYIAMEQQLAALELQWGEMSTKYMPDSRELRDKVEEIESLRDRIASITRSVEGKVIHTVNPVYEELETQSAHLKATIDGLHNSRNEMAKTIKASESKLAHLNQVSYEFTSVEHAVSVENKMHSFYLAKLNDARFVDAMNRNRITSLSVIQKAEAPPQNKKPVYTSAAMSSGLGILLALAIVFLLDIFKPRLNSPEQVSEFLRLPVIGTINENGSRERIIGPDHV